jgi:hypothetical protein
MAKSQPQQGGASTPPPQPQQQGGTPTPQQGTPVFKDWASI